MRSFTLAERRPRLARRHFLSPDRPADSITGTAATLVGLHATDPATPYLSLWARLPGVTVADLDAELYQRRTLVKHLAMRRTLWMVRTEDLPLIHENGTEYAGGHHDRTTRTISVCSENQGARHMDVPVVLRNFTIRIQVIPGMTPAHGCHLHRIAGIASESGRAG